MMMGEAGNEWLKGSVEGEKMQMSRVGGMAMGTFESANREDFQPLVPR